MTAIANNAAGRFWKLLDDAKSDKELRKKNAAVAWCELLDIKEGDRSLLLQRLGKVMAQPALIAEKIRREKDLDHGTYLSWEPSVEAAFGNLNFAGGFSDFIDPITKEALLALKFCADRLSRTQPEEMLPDDQLEALRETVGSLIDDLQLTKMPQRLQEYMLERLDQVYVAIQEYQLVGPKPFQKILESTFGTLALQPNLYRDIEETDLGKRFWRCMARLLLITGLMVNIPQIADRIRELLPAAETAAANVEGSGGRTQTNGEVSESKSAH